MRRRLTAIYLLIVFAPLALLAWLGVRVTESERVATRARFEAVLSQRLLDVSAALAKGLAEIERGLEKRLDVAEGLDPEPLREAIRKEPLARNAFVLLPTGRLFYPPPDGDLTEEERGFLAKTRAIWRGRAVLYEPPRAEAVAGATVAGAARGSAPSGLGGENLLDLARARPSGWIAWHWEEGLHLLFWRRGKEGRVTGFEVDRVALLARLLGALPPVAAEGSIVLSDSRKDPFFVWGEAPFEPGAERRPIASRQLEHPLDSLRLDYYPSPGEETAFLESSLAFGTSLSLAAAGLAMLGLAIYFFREQSRQLRDAERRVSFVTQVSHELKTPLTNIRLYAELLEEELAGADPEDGSTSAMERHLGVIVAESQRLTRLINNVLTFSKQKGDRLAVHRRKVEIDPLIDSVLAQFRPAFEQKGIRIEHARAAAAPIEADPDAVGQILANLFSNVEKYAAGGGLLSVTSAEEPGRTTVTVSDRGPGVPAADRSRIFEPFYRIGDRLSDGVTGTGIGLTIARDLARLHGGDLELVPSAEGASFRLVLPVVKAEERA